MGGSRPGSPEPAEYYRRRSLERAGQQQQHAGEQLQVHGEGVYGSSTPSWVQRLSRPSTAPTVRAAFLMQPGEALDGPAAGASQSRRQSGPRRPGVPGWVDRLASKPPRGRAASPVRRSTDSRPQSSAGAR